MQILNWLFSALSGRPRQTVRRHVRRQAFGRRWTQHRRRRIERYSRKRRGRRSTARRSPV